MKRALTGRAAIFSLLFITLLLQSAAPSAAQSSGDDPQILERPDLARFFADRGIAGTFVLYDVAAGKIAVVGRERAEKPLVPASTFKIANSLIALETGVVKDENEVIPYGGKPQPFKQWEQDMPMREAIAMSNVPVYQELARRIGHERYRTWLTRIGYGNAKTGEVVDRFWLDGPLQISAVEQTKFLARLAAGKLPASERSQAIVRDIIKLESREGRTLHGKTGWQFSADPQIGWWVGWVERDGKTYPFALNMDMGSAADAPKRLEIGKALLAELGIY
jgi:beta-lactamase class D